MWDKRAMDAKTKLSRVMLTVNLLRRQFRISLKVRTTKADFDKAVSSSRVLSNAAMQLKKELNDYVSKAETILERLPNPSQETFTRLFKSETDLFLSNKTDVRILFEQKVIDLKNEERFSNSRNCQLAIISLHKYKSPIYFEDVDERWLKGYVSFMVSSGNSITTAQIYLRQLRSVFNDAIKAGYVSEKHYPFKGFSMGSRIKSKAVLYPVQLKALLQYETVGIREARAKAFFFFCYLCNGINPHDMFMLKWKNVQANMITFVRHKTRHTSSNGQKEIKVYMHDLTKAIIKEWGNPPTDTDDFIFPFLNNKMTAEKMNDTISRHKRISNKMLSHIGRKLGFEVHLCLNLARHSFATKLKIENKVSLAAISDAMGHTTTNTTMHYMKSLPDEMIKDMSAGLLEFDEPKLLVI